MGALKTMINGKSYLNKFTRLIDNILNREMLTLCAGAVTI